MDVGSRIFDHSKSRHRKSDHPPGWDTLLSLTAQAAGRQGTGNTQQSNFFFSDSLSSLLDLHLPRFSISATYNLEKILPLIGLSNLFDMEADLSGIMGQLNKTVSRVSHKAVVDMNEKGTEAAAASGLLSQPPALNTTLAPHAHFNRPFLLLLWEVTTQSLLFLGKVVNPAAG